METYKDITEAVLSQSSLQSISDKFREKVCSYPLIRNASLRIKTVKGAKVSSNQFLIQALGELSVALAGLPDLWLQFSGLAEYKQSERRVYLTGFEILNDMAGITNKLIEATGIGIGRSLHVNDEDDALIQSLLSD